MLFIPVLHPINSENIIKVSQYYYKLFSSENFFNSYILLDPYKPVSSYDEEYLIKLFNNNLFNMEYIFYRDATIVGLFRIFCENYRWDNISLHVTSDNIYQLLEIYSDFEKSLLSNNNIRKLKIKYLEDDLLSKELSLANGFKQEGRLESFVFIDGLYRNVIIDSKFF